MVHWKFTTQFKSTTTLIEMLPLPDALGEKQRKPKYSSTSAWFTFVSHGQQKALRERRKGMGCHR